MLRIISQICDTIEEIFIIIFSFALSFLKFILFKPLIYQIDILTKQKIEKIDEII